jgi:hypothetical protein
MAVIEAVRAIISKMTIGTSQRRPGLVVRISKLSVSTVMAAYRMPYALTYGLLWTTECIEASGMPAG